MLRWTFSDRFHQHYLLLDGEEVVMLDQALTGEFLVHANRHRPMTATPIARCPSMRLSMAWAERWARVNKARLRRELAERDARRRAENPFLRVVADQPGPTKITPQT